VLSVADHGRDPARILFFGAGEAGIGIGDLVVAALMDEGFSESEARGRCWFLDSKGLVVKSRSNLARRRTIQKIPVVACCEIFFFCVCSWSPTSKPLAAIEALRPSALSGVSGHAGTFSKEIVEAVTRINERPIIFALSNPTTMAECTAEQAYAWSDGLGVFASGSRLITDETFSLPRALAGEVAESDLAAGRVHPRWTVSGRFPPRLPSPSPIWRIDADSPRDQRRRISPNTSSSSGGDFPGVRRPRRRREGGNSLAARQADSIQVRSRFRLHKFGAAFGW
jgi:hypothetical protein